MPAKAKRRIFIVSDGTGRTCEQVVRSALVQFDDERVRLVRRPSIRSNEQILAVLEEAEAGQDIIFFTLVALDARRYLKDTANELMVESVDVLGPVMSGLNSMIHRSPKVRPGLYYKSEQQYFDRIDAIDYTLRHDDGQRLNQLNSADVVLVGVSRVSKSSTCFFLAYRGIRAANVPLLPHADPPKELIALDHRRVIGLGVNPHRLIALREARIQTMGTSKVERYAELDAVNHELRVAREHMARHGWARIDVSYMAIEEIAKQVRQHIEESGLRRRPRRRRTSAK